MNTQQLIDQAFQHGRKNAAHDLLAERDVIGAQAVETCEMILESADRELAKIADATGEANCPPGSVQEAP